MARKLTKSNAHFQRAVKRLPLGVASNFRYWGEDRTIYVKRGVGARITDLDDNVYVDYRMGYGPAILGYAHPEVDQAAREGMEVGGVFALSTERELAVAERISKMVPAAELVRFSNSGTEAVMAGLRLARAYTGKDDYVILEGSYHGLFDAAMWFTPMDKWSQVGDPEVKPYSEGVPISTRSFAHFVQANDANQLEDVFKRHAHKIACMLIEPIMGNCLGIAAEPDYLRAARELCDKHGVVLLIDEVKTGFRVARGGVQELYGINADLCTFAKAVGNGYPISVLAGREEIMRKIGQGVAHGGTYTAHSISLAAAEKTLQILDETDALERIADYGTRLRQGMHAALGARGIPHSFVGHPSMSGLYFAHEPPRNYRAWKSSDYSFYDAMAQVLHDEGVLCEPDSREPWFVSAAHDASCLSDTLKAFEIAVDATLKSGAGQGAAHAGQGYDAESAGLNGVAVGSPKNPDAIIVGAGHNGLITACYLARSGLKVLVLERQPYIGGAAVSRRLYEDFTYSNCSYVCSLLRPEIIRALELPKYGLQVIPYEGGCTMMQGGGHLALYDNHDALRREIGRHSKRDAEAYDRYSRDVMRQCKFIKPLLMREPPDPTSFKPRDLQELLYLGRRFHGLGEERMYDTLRFWTMSAADFLEEYFESEIVKAHFAGSSIIGTALGPRSPGSAYVLLHHYMGDIDDTVGAWGFARGGMGAISNALGASFQASGGTIRTAAPVARILVRNGRAAGVALADGEEIRAKLVISNLDVKRTFLESMDAKDLPDDFLRQVRNFKIRGSSGKLNIALDGLPSFPAIPAGSPATRGDMHVTDTLEMMERAYDDWKDGRWSRAPYIDMLIPSQIDPTMVPDGKHYMSVFVQYCPYQLADGPWDSAKRKAFGDTVINTIARHSPNFKDLILHAEIRTPWDIENEVGLTEGNIFQGELTLDQLLFNRPYRGMRSIGRR